MIPDLLHNRDFEPTFLENGSKCPYDIFHEDRHVGDIAYLDQMYCDNCNLCKNKVIQTGTNEVCGVMCMYRKDPPFEPLYKLGEEYWYLWTYDCPQRRKIRKVEWNPRRACWEYTFARQQQGYEEKLVFTSRKKCDEYMLLKQAADMLHAMQVHKEKWGALPSGTMNLLTSGNKTNS